MTTPIRITDYRVDPWLNQKTNESMYGVSVKIDGVRKWMRVIDDGKAVIFDKRKEADAYIVDMKSQRDAQGLKIL